MTRSARERNAFTRVELAVWIAACLFVLSALLLPAAQKARRVDAQIRCLGNLKQLGQATASYERTHGHLPPRGTSGVDGSPRHGWVAFLLPHLQQEALVKKYRYDLNWDDAKNPGVIATQLPSLQCPATPAQDRTVTGKTSAMDQSAPPFGIEWKAASGDYGASTSIDGSARPLGPTEDRSGAFRHDTYYRYSDFPDGTTTTLMFVEQAGRPQIWRLGKRADKDAAPDRGIWAHNHANEIQYAGHTPDGLSYPWPCAVNCSNFRGIYGFHDGTASVCFVDGSARRLGAKTDVYVLFALVTKNGGEVIGIEDFDAN